MRFLKNVTVRSLAILLMLAIIISSMFACSSNTDGEESTKDSTPSVEDKTEDNSESETKPEEESKESVTEESSESASEESSESASEEKNDTESAESEKDAHDIDYSLKENWAYFAEGEGKDVDVFFVAPTVDMAKDGNTNMSMTNEKVKQNFVGAINMQRGIYDESATIYAPYYRQMTFMIYNTYKTEAEMKPYFDVAYADVAAAFEYYIENVNQGRPFILAGFSQGAQILIHLMEDYFDDAKYSEKLVAAYCIGWRITEEQIQTYPHLKMAQGEGDGGVIITFNSEAEGVEESIVVPKDTKTLAINPLNWKTDSTPADASLNQGACFTDYSANIKSEIKNLTGAYLDSERGTLRVTGVKAEDYSSSLFPNGVYHLYDYQFFFRNLQSNVKVRVQNYLSAK